VRGITRLLWAAALILVLALAAGCGSTGQTMSESSTPGEDTTAPAQETGGFQEFETPSVELEVPAEEPSPGLFP